MSFKLSALVIENPSKTKNDKAILNALGWRQFSLVEETTFAACMLPRDGSISIGYYNNAIVICEDLQFSRPFCTNDYTTEEELALSKLFPNQEILSLNCYGTNNSHGYSLTKDGKKLRYKFVMHSFPKCEGGEELKEELAIYKQAISKENNVYKWKFDNLPDSEFLEDQLMEEFTFKVGKRLLGVEIGTGEDEELMSNTVFRKYKKETLTSDAVPEKKNISTQNFQSNNNENGHSQINLINDDNIVMQEFTSVRWQADVYNIGLKNDGKAKVVGLPIGFVFITIMILGVAFILEFILNLVGFKMGSTYWSIFFVFILFICYRLYKIQSDKSSSDYFSKGIIKDAQNKNIDVDKIIQKEVRFTSHSIQWEIKENGTIMNFPYNEIKSAQLGQDFIYLSRKNETFQSIKLVGLSKEEKYQISEWMRRKSNINNTFEWVELT